MSQGLGTPQYSLQVSFTTTPFATPSWVDITQYLRSVQIKRGRQHVLGQFEPGQLTAVLDLRVDRSLDPLNTSSPYSPNIDVNKRVQFIANWNVLTAAQAGSTITGGWTATGCSITYPGAQVRMSSTAGGTISANTPTGTSGAAVIGGRTYTFLATLLANTTTRVCTPSITWYTAAGASISTSGGSGVTDSGSPGTQITMEAVAPSNAAFASVQFSIAGTATSEVHKILTPGLFPSPGITVWDPGGPVTLFTGFAESWTPAYPDNANADVTLVATDGLRMLDTMLLNSTRYASTVVADGTTAFYRLNDPVGSNMAADTSGNNRTASWVGTPTLGSAGHSYIDTSTSASYPVVSAPSTTWALLPYSSRVTGTAGWSVEFWINTTYSDSHIAPIFYQWGTGTADHVHLSFVYFGILSGTLYLDVQDGPAFNGNTKSGTIAVNDGNWHHCVLTASSDGKTFSMYVDGVLDTTLVFGVAPNVAIDNDSFQIVALGTPSNFGALAPGYSGLLADCAIYQGVTLTGTQVTTHHNYGLLASFPLQDTGARVGAVLDAISWPAADRSIATGVSQCQVATSSLTSSSVLNYLQTVAETERGFLFINGAGQVEFLNRNYPIGPVGSISLATFGDAVPPTTEIPYKPGPTIGVDNLDLYNAAVVQRVGGVAQTARNATSETQYGLENALSTLSSLLATTDSEMLDRARYEVAHFAFTVVRVSSITVDVMGDPGTRMPAILHRELGDRITVKKRPPAGSSGSTYSQPQMIEYIEWDFDARASQGSMTCTLALTPYEAQPFWLLGDATNGLLGQTTVLSY